MEYLRVIKVTCEINERCNSREYLVRQNILSDNNRMTKIVKKLQMNFTREISPFRVKIFVHNLNNKENTLYIEEKMI